MNSPSLLVGMWCCGAAFGLLAGLGLAYLYLRTRARRAARRIIALLAQDAWRRHTPHSDVTGVATLDGSPFTITYPGDQP